MSKKAVIIKRSFISLAAIVAGFVGVVAMRPDTFKVERTAAMAAPASVVFAQVNDFHNWGAWSPWEKLDPDMKRAFEGPRAGAGSSYSWDGSDAVGAGRMTILESRPDELVRLKLEFFRPMEDVCTTDFAFKPEGNRTGVTWIMSGKHTFISKVICMFMNMDTMIGGDFERGLAQLKAKSESEAERVARQESPAPEATR
jgi:hypothetical protein